MVVESNFSELNNTFDLILVWIAFPRIYIPPHEISEVCFLLERKTRALRLQGFVNSECKRG